VGRKKSLTIAAARGGRLHFEVPTEEKKTAGVVAHFRILMTPWTFFNQHIHWTFCD
jgi:hypothetical protein